MLFRGVVLTICSLIVVDLCEFYYFVLPKEIEMCLITELFLFLCFPAAKSIDDGGITVPEALPLTSRNVLAIKNHPLTLHCPIIISRDVRVLDLWWAKVRRRF